MQLEMNSGVKTAALYARVSTFEQSCGLQLDELAATPASASAECSNSSMWE